MIPSTHKQGAPHTEARPTPRALALRSCMCIQVWPARCALAAPSRGKASKCHPGPIFLRRGGGAHHRGAPKFHQIVGGRQRRPAGKATPGRQPLRRGARQQSLRLWEDQFNSGKTRSIFATLVQFWEDQLKSKMELKRVKSGPKFGIGDSRCRFEAAQATHEYNCAF